MSNKARTPFSGVPLVFIVLYFFAIFVSTMVLVAAILGLVYLQISAHIPENILWSAIDQILVVLLIAFAVFIVLSGIGSWLLASAVARQRQFRERIRVDTHLLDSATDSIFVHDMKGSCLYANQAAYMTRGYEQKELMAVTFDELDVPEYAKLNEARISELLEKGEVNFESTHARKDSSPINVEVVSRILRSDNNKLIITAVRDITERKQTEAELKEASEKLRKAMEGTIHTIALTAEMRDPYTAGHQQRVAKLACAIAREMNLSEVQTEGIRVAGSLHDIGKIYVPAEILSKPGHLRKNEMNLIKDHAEVGYDLLKTVEFPWPVAQIVLQHHERIDGSGYPRGLSGEDISLEARIMSVADVIEAMSSHRPYRPAFSIEKALLEVIQNRSVLYDPEVVDICLKLFNEKQFTFD
jgi:PAS domain S-box-containing protein/putative nucleotidyltransferase with HDIG domain